MKNSLVSIIIPAFNASKYIMETLESIEQQIYSDWEIIFVDDCSTDNTVKLVNQFAEKSSKSVKIICNPSNLGVCGSRNEAVAHASGAWLALLDSDDVWLPNHLETLMFTLGEDEQLNVIYSGFFAFLDDVTNIIFKQEICPEVLTDFNIALFARQIGITSSTALIEKKCWQNVGGMVQGLNYCEEMELFIRLAKDGAKFKFSGFHTLLYRKHSDTNSASDNVVKMSFGTLYIYQRHFDWEEIPVKTRIKLLYNAHITCARLVWHDDLTTAVINCLKAIKVKIGLLYKV